MATKVIMESIPLPLPSFVVRPAVKAIGAVKQLFGPDENQFAKPSGARGGGAHFDADDRFSLITRRVDQSVARPSRPSFIEPPPRMATTPSPIAQPNAVPANQPMVPASTGPQQVEDSQVTAELRESVVEQRETNRLLETIATSLTNTTSHPRPAPVNVHSERP